MSDLIDTTEMYLRTIVELEEEGISPMRARIAERLAHSGPTVSQTIARMERDGLVVVGDERQLELTPIGRQTADRVLRKHRIAECLLVDVVKVPWEDVHAEACRWEHVISDDVERRLLLLLGNPTTSPFGNPIPALAELDGAAHSTPARGRPLAEVAEVDVRAVIVQRIAEPLQDDAIVMAQLRRAGAVPGAAVEVRLTDEAIQVSSGGESIELSAEAAAHVLVGRVGADRD